jgi:acetyl/propionyl-CoA carboxylase alpha subunit
LYSGYSIPPFYDSLVAKLVCFAENRDDAIRIMKDALFSFRISGIPTTIPFHISALSDKRFLEGNYDTSFINEVRPFSSKEGEIAAAILFQLPKKVHFLKKYDEGDLWMKSRFDWIHLFNPGGFPHSSYRWNK